jgi:4-carboxymuconolactone decarboxylase
MIGKFASLIGGICFAMSGTASAAPAEERSELTERRQAIVPIAAFTASGDVERLKPALAAGLDAGLTVSEVREVLVQLYAYAGFPRSLNGLGTFVGVLDERAARGIVDDAGREASPILAEPGVRERGTRVQTLLIGAPVKGRVLEFAPAIDTFLKEHLFGDIFGSDVLDFHDREVSTIAALAAMQGTGSQLLSHTKVALNIGITRDQLRSLGATLAAQVGQTEAARARDALADAVAARSETSSSPITRLQPERPNPAQETRSTMQILRSGSQPSVQGPSDWFTGTVRIDAPFKGSGDARVGGATVTFEPGARTNWHTHPLGQTVIVTAGLGWAQREGGPVEEIRPGDIVWFAPGEKHWHGATATTAMTHIAIAEAKDGKVVDWLEPVADAQFTQGH